MTVKGKCFEWIPDMEAARETKDLGKEDARAVWRATSKTGRAGSREGQDGEHRHTSPLGKAALQFKHHHVFQAHPVLVHTHAHAL